MAEQYIFTIEHLSKAYGKREVLKNIWLAFYPGAKIGVIGSNGAGKSSLLRIMALEDKDFLGTARLTPGFTLGHVPQEPRLNEAKDVRGNIEEAVAATRALLTRHEEISNRWASRSNPTRWRSCSTSWARCRKRSTPPTPGSSIGSSKSPWTPCGCRPATPRRPRCPAANGAASPCARSCCKSPTCCCSMSRPTISTPIRSPGWNGICENIAGTVVAVTHDRYFLDNVAQWILELDRGEGMPFKGNYSSWLEQKKGRLEKEESQEVARRKALERELEWARMAPRGPRRQEQGPPGRV